MEQVAILTITFLISTRICIAVQVQAYWKSQFLQLPFWFQLSMILVVFENQTLSRNSYNYLSDFNQVVMLFLWDVCPMSQFLQLPFWFQPSGRKGMLIKRLESQFLQLPFWFQLVYLGKELKFPSMGRNSYNYLSDFNFLWF